VAPDPPSPRIFSLSWGILSVDGRVEPYKDAKLFPGGSREWDWRETGTRHSPGVQPADVQELIAAGARVIVLSCGMLNRLKTQPATLALLEARGIECHVLQTQEAVAAYNDLREHWKVGALIHSTC
jgi:hypothetical protein